MKTKNIEVVFHKNPTEKNIPWKNHVEEIINGIKSGVQNSFKVYMKNLMPIEEMDNVAKELCDAIKYHCKYNNTKYYRSEECVDKDYVNLFSSAKYIIELS
mgnify:FL=1